MMLLWKCITWGLAGAFLGLALAGCSLSGDSQQDDEKEQHFVLGKGRVNAGDFDGAVEEFKEALEVSPHSAPAHYQLAWLFENKLTDPAAAIYHYQEYLALDPKAKNPDVIKQRIFACKQKLVTDVMELPSSPAAQRQIEKLAEQNRKMQEELDKWHAYYYSQLAAHTNAAPYVPGTALPTTAPEDVTATTMPLSPNRTGVTPPPKSVHPAPPVQPRLRTHVVAPGETLATIARKAGVSLAELQRSNPGLNPRHLHTGQTINLPFP